MSERTDNRTTLGDLELAPDAEVLKPTTGATRLHLLGADCRIVAANNTRMKPVPAASLWDDTPICEFCLDRVESTGTGEWTPPIDPQGARGDD